MTDVSPASSLTGFAPPAVRYYPERKKRDPGRLDEIGETAVAGLLRGWIKLSAPLGDSLAVRAVRKAEARLADLDEARFADEAVRLRRHAKRSGLTRATERIGVALAADAVRRHMGIVPRKVQIRGALTLLRGQLIEMDTGEGKTITATLAAAAAALAGIPVHVITVNNYLAERDADLLGPVYEMLGLRVGVILEQTPHSERREVYRADIVFASNTEIAFDYLRDRIAFGPEGPQGLRQRLHRIVRPADERTEPIMRGLSFAIVDEADSVLVDEARTPLIISRQTDPAEEAAWTGTALDVAGGLERGRHYRVIGDERRVELLQAGRDRIAELVQGESGLWESAIRREEVIHQALTALLVFKRGEHYLVREGKVQIVDEYTGRLQPDRSWSDGMHQLIEAKEGVEITGQNLAIARMTYQRFFRRYERLAGMTGTAHEVRSELASVYGLTTVRIPPHKPSRLRARIPRITITASAKWDLVVRKAAAEAAKGRPVLIGTRSVAASETVSQALTAVGLKHVVLNAENDHESAEIIAQAGLAGRITVATNMAGRGVDIALGDGVSDCGGLHVILTERHDAGRIDRQLAGRAARRGEPGSYQAILSLEDPLMDVINAPFARAFARLPLVGVGTRLKLIDRAQRRAERSHARLRRDLVKQDRRLNRLLSFTGGLE